MLLIGGSTGLSTLSLSKWNPDEAGTGSSIKTFGGDTVLEKFSSMFFATPQLETVSLCHSEPQAKNLVFVTV
jgi:hypothetical protein